MTTVKFTKFVSLLLVLAMFLALCGFGMTTALAYDEEDTETSSGIDYDAAFAMYDPDTVVFTADGEDVTWQELFYEIAYYASYMSYLTGEEITDWSAACPLYTDEYGNYYSYGTVVLQNAVTLLFQYHTLYSRLTEAGVEPGQDTADYVEEVRQETIDYSFDGDEEAFLEYLDSMFCTDEIWTWFNEVDGMYAYEGFDSLYGEFGSDYPDEDVMAYAAGDEDGGWTEYVQIKQIYLYSEEDGTADESDDAEEEEDAGKEPSETAEAILEALDAADDLDETFDALYDEYNEEPDLDPYTGGWCIYQGDTLDAIYEAALDMEEYDHALVDTGSAEVIVMKVPVDPDAGVYYDPDEDIMYTLRYYAAWQAYAEQVNDWIVEADGDWTEEFEDFSLSALFTEADPDYVEGLASSALDFDAAFAAYDPDTVVFTVDGDEVTWQEFFYEIAYYADYVAYLQGYEITAWSDICPLYIDEEGDYYTYEAVVLQDAVTTLFQYHALYSHLTEAGVEPGQATEDYVAEVRQEVIDDSFGGDEEAFLEYLDSLYCTDEIWTWFNEVDGMYAYDGFDSLYGEFGSDFSDEDVMAYAAGDEDGAWTEYVQIKQIYLYSEEEGTTDESDDAEEEETVSEPSETAEAILEALDAADDLDAVFDELYDEYNEEPDLDPYTGGWCIYRGDTLDAIYEAALDMEEYDHTLVDIDGAEVIVMKVPVDPDAGVYYNSGEDIMYTLRYYAAWQAYADMVNHDWIDNAEVAWTEEFEDFSLSALFGEDQAQDDGEDPDAVEFTGFETYDPDTVVATVNGSEVTWREYYYWLYSDLMNLEYYLYYYYGMSLSDWDAYEVSSEYTNAEVVQLDAQYYITQYHSMETGAAELGITITEEDEEDLQAYFEEYADLYAGDGDGVCTDEEAAAYEEQLEEQYVDRDLYDYINSVSLLYDNVFFDLYGEWGSLLPDEDVAAYAEENDIVAAKHILLTTEDLNTGEALDDETLEEKYALVEDILAQLQAVEDDPDALNDLFDELMAEYTEDTGYSSYPDGYIYQTGQMVQEFEDAMAELEEGELSDIVETEYGWHIILRMPVDPDGILMGYGYPLRYIVANQLYSDMIDEWEDTADVQWTEGFEDLDLAAVLGPLS